MIPKNRRWNVFIPHLDATFDTERFMSLGLKIWIMSITVGSPLESKFKFKVYWQKTWGLFHGMFCLFDSNRMNELLFVYLQKIMLWRHVSWFVCNVMACLHLSASLEYHCTNKDATPIFNKSDILSDVTVVVPISTCFYGNSDDGWLHVQNHEVLLIVDTYRFNDTLTSLNT